MPPRYEITQQPPSALRLSAPRAARTMSRTTPGSSRGDEVANFVCAKSATNTGWPKLGRRCRTSSCGSFSLRRGARYREERNDRTTFGWKLAA